MDLFSEAAGVEGGPDAEGSQELGEDGRGGAMQEQ